MANVADHPEVKQLFEEKQDSKYVLIRVTEDGELEAWTAPTGKRVEKEETHWTRNPEEARQYDDEKGAKRAKESMQEKYPALKASVLIAYNKAEQILKKTEFCSMEDLLLYDRKATTIYALEHNGKITFYLDEQERDNKIHSNIGYFPFTFKLVR